MRALFLVAALTLLLPPAHAAPTLCPEHFAGGAAPDLLNPRRGAGARALCFEAFALLHSPVSRTALYAAEHLTAADVEGARAIPRQGEFHPEPRLPPEERAELHDYARSGFDRGHLAPAGDMPDPAAQEDSFSLANMVPQAPKLNRGLWERIESTVRTMAVRRGELYVVTGPIFAGQRLQTVGQVLVPTHVFKAVLDPIRGQAAAYLVPNRDDGDWQAVSMAQLAQMTGMDVFPALSAPAKSVPMRLPAPIPRRSRGARS